MSPRNGPTDNGRDYRVGIAPRPAAGTIRAGIGPWRKKEEPAWMVPKGGLEPPRVAPHAPQTCASANSATSAPASAKYAPARRALSTKPPPGLARQADDAADARLAEAGVEGIADPLAQEVVR